MAILVENMKMPTRCWDCFFYKTGHEESYCGLTGKDVARWTPTPRPDDCPLIEVEPKKHGHWIKITQDWVDDAEYLCSCCGRKIKAPSALNPAWAFPYCHCGVKMDEVEE